MREGGKKEQRSGHYYKPGAQSVHNSFTGVI